MKQPPQQRQGPHGKDLLVQTLKSTPPLQNTLQNTLTTLLLLTTLT